MTYALLLLLAWPFAARAAAPPDPSALESYGFDPSVPLPRVKTIPPWLLKAWADTDEMPYEAYSPTAPEAAVLASAFDGLPPPMKKVLSERVIAVYLVKNLKGNGITNWVLDPSSRTYVYMILNPAGFRQTLSELMTERDLTLFRGKADLSVEAGDGPGILYSVAHESAHAFDYVRYVTPFTEPGLHRVLNPGFKGKKPWDAWSDYAEPKPAADYPLRAKLHFYGFGDPELAPAQAAELCSQWARTPFASFYGSRSWAEDLAELFVLRHLTEDLRRPLRRTCAGRTYSPWENPKVRARAERLLAPLYR
ncbi:MAG: hypothetical protein HYV14_06080 [Elusimicrobia bacterium]|nr:hypothetical protein [Elusimicrobiota bacterium]